MEDVTGVAIDWRARTPLVGVSRWRCLEQAGGVTSERRQHWRVVAFVHQVAYEVRSARGRGLVDPLHVAFFGPEEPYTTAHPCGTGDRGSALVLREDLFQDLLRDDPGRLAPVGFCPSSVLVRQRTLLRAIETGTADDLRVEEETIGVVDALLAATDRPAPKRHHRDLAEGAQELLGREFRRALRLQEIASCLQITPAHLCRVFRRVTGSSIHRYLNHLRLRAALESLEAGEEDLSGLALDVGFSSHSHFTYAFRREFGIPPSACRARFR